MTEPRLETSRKVYTNHWSLQLSRFMKGSCCWRKSVFSMINSILWRKETHKQHLYLENDLKMIVIFHNYHKMIWIFDAFLIFILRSKCELFATWIRIMAISLVYSQETAWHQFQCSNFSRWDVIFGFFTGATVKLRS